MKSIPHEKFSRQVPATPADMSYSNEDFMDSDSFISYHNDEISDTETTDMLVTEPSEISTPVFDLPRDNTVPLKIISTTHIVMEQPTESDFPQVVISQKTTPLTISETSNPLATSAVAEHDAATTVRSQAVGGSQQSVSDLHHESLTTLSMKSESVDGNPTETASGPDGTNPTSFFFIVALAVLLYIAGVVLGCFLHWCYRRNRDRNFQDSKVWRDDDGQGSFTIAGEF